MNLARLTTALAQAHLAASDLAQTLLALGTDAKAAESARDPFAVLIYNARQAYQTAIDKESKSDRHLRAAVGKSYQDAQALGYEGSESDWLRILRPGIVFRAQRPVYGFPTKPPAPPSPAAAPRSGDTHTTPTSS